MSRKAKEVERARSTGTYTTARTLGATLGYSSLKPYQLPDHLVVVIHLPAVAAQEDQGHGSPIGQLLPAVQRLLMADPERFAPPDALFLVDCTPLIPTQTTPRAVVDKENSAPKLGKQLGKPMNPRPSESVQPSPDIDAYFKSHGALERLVPSVRRVFSKVASHVVDVPPTSDVSSAIGGVLYSALLSDCMSDGPPLSDINGARLDPDACDAMGRCVFWSEVTVEMRRDSKQPEVRILEVDVHQLAGPPAPKQLRATSASTVPSASTSAAPPAATKAAPVKPSVGALILRGNRCVLVRSLESPPAWNGMRVPTVELGPDERGVDGAMRAAAEFCDIGDEWLDSELEVVPSVPPAALHMSDECHALIYPLYATRPPPPGPLEEADLSDEDDTYDWYTWPRAVHALRHDAHGLTTLRTLACAIAAAVHANRLASKWGGYFGQEWLGSPSSPPVQLLPQAPSCASAAQVPSVDPPAGDSLPQRDVPSGGATGPLAALHEVARTSGAEGAPRLLPVTVLSGFLGAGKTTLLTHLLENSSGYRIAVIVNDMASINIDAELVRRASVLQKEEKMVELSNGCICCTLREDLLSSLAELAAENRFDHVIVESSGISEPLPVAETFTFEDEATGTSLAKVASLYNLVTVVDSPFLFESLASEDSLADRGWEAGDGDERVISQLLCEQLEFADVLVVNKSDLIGDDELDAVEKFVRQLNPGAEIIRTSRGRLEPSLLLDKARFSQQRAEAHSGWLAEAREHEHTPETLEYGISSFIFRARRPFHPERLHAALGCRLRPGALGELLRLKGITWLATRHDTQAHAALAGTQFSLAPGPPWWDAIPRELWPEGLAEDIQPLWHDEHADRQTELVCIGRHLNHAAADAALRECLLTDDEMAAGAAVWAALHDPFAEAWEAAMAPADGHDHDH